MNSIPKELLEKVDMFTTKSLFKPNLENKMRDRK
jgi:hypothetical protein